MACSPTGAEIELLIADGEGPHNAAAWQSAVSGGTAHRYKIISETLTKRKSWITTIDLTGDRQVRCDDRIPGPSIVVGDIHFRVRAGDMATLLPRIIGTESPSGTFETATGDPPYFSCLIDRVTQTYNYWGLKANRVIVRGRASALQGDNAQPIEMIVSVIGKDREKGVAIPSSPAAAFGTGEGCKPYIFEDATLTIDSSNYVMQDFVLAIDHMLEPEYNGTLYPSDICPIGDKLVRLRTRHPYRSGELPLTLLSDSGVDGNLKFLFSTNSGSGSVSTDFQFGCLQLVETDPNATGPGRIPLFIDLLAGTDGTDPDLRVVNDAVTAT